MRFHFYNRYGSKLQSNDHRHHGNKENISVVTSESEHTPIVSNINTVYHSSLSQWCWKSSANNWVLYADTLAMKIQRLNVGQTVNCMFVLHTYILMCVCNCVYLQIV